MKTIPSYEVKVFTGQRRGYHGEFYDRKELVDLIKRHQKEADLEIPVRVTETHFVVGEYEEPGFELTAINFPTHPHEPETIDKFMIELADRIVVFLDQVHVSVVTPTIVHLRSS